MKKINLFNKTISPLSSGYGFSPFHGKGVRRNRRGVWGFPFPGKRGPAEQPEGMGITPSPLSPTKFLKFCGTRFGATPSWKEGERSGRGGLWFAALVALFVATPSFAEPTELDKKTVASKAYVDTKQDIIETGLVDWGYDEVGIPAIVTTDATGTSLIGNSVGVLTREKMESNGLGLGDFDNVENLVPTTAAVMSEIYSKQNAIDETDEEFVYNLLTNRYADGSVIVTTSDYGVVNQRGIATAPTYDNNHQLTNGNWLPTMGALVNQISTAVNKLTWTATETTATKEYSTTFDGTANNWPAADANKLVDGTALANGLAQKQNKMTCVGWNSETHTDEHCLLWSIAE